MHVRFHGAAGDVTGSLHEVHAAGRRVLLDCGLIQGSRSDEARNADPFPFEPPRLDAVVISHAHIDHIGRVPLLVARGYAGPIFAQRATAELMPVMLLDAASLAESDVARANRRRPAEAPRAVPLYTHDDVHAAMKQVVPVDYDTDVTIADGVVARLRDAGHILGSASVELRADGRTLLFSGDLGPHGVPILRDAAPVHRADLVLMESTYGDRLHRDRAATMRELGEILELAWRDRGTVLIPAFAVGRTQELLYAFATHWQAWDMQRWHIVLDSPMARRVAGVYERHQDLFDDEARAVWARQPTPFSLPNLHHAQTPDESRAVNGIASGAIIIAGSGMCNGGRILHHLRQRLDRPDTHVVFVGYQSEGTLGRRLVDGARWVRIHGHDVPVRAQRHTVGGLSAHTDQAGLLQWYGAFDGAPPLALVHGEDRAREALAGEIGARFGTHALLPRPGFELTV